MTPLLVRDVMKGDAQTFGLLMSAYGVGTIVASVVVAQLVVRRPGVLMFVFELLAAIAVLIVGLLPVLPLVIVLMALTGVGLASSTVIWEALLQRRVPEQMLGRVASIDLLGNSLINPLAPIAAAALVGPVGPAGAFVVAGAYAVLFASIGLIWSPLRGIQESTR
jgi:DHA3 family tetracycline resistance protein-like MFS transporter